MGAPKKNLPKTAAIITVFVSVLLLLLSIFTVGLAYAKNDRFYPGVMVGDVPVGGLTRQEAKDRLQALVDATNKKEVHVAVPDVTKPRDEATGQYPEETITTTVEKLGLTVEAHAALVKAWDVGHQNPPTKWIADVIRTYLTKAPTFEITASLDSTKVRSFIDTEVAPKAAPPKPARVVVKGKEVAIEDPVAGLSIDNAELEKTIISAVQASLDSDPLAFRLPPTLADSPIGRTAVQPFADTLARLGNTKLSLKAEETNISPSKEELLQWFALTLNEKNELSLGVNTERISTYLQKQKTLDQKKSLASVTRAAAEWIENPKNSAEVAVALKPNILTVGEFEANLYPGKYIFVNLREQKLYRMNGGTMEKVYRVSTGKWSTPTPRGAFQISSKHPRAYSKTYGLYMPYWQNFLGTATDGTDLPKGDYGLHELPEWPNGYKEGQGHLGTAVSHGCVRLGVGEAKEIYEWTEIGTPVVIK